jgi:hypothetical protein
MERVWCTRQWCVLFPNTKDARFWHELYGRGDEEMSERYGCATPLSALSIVENPEEDPAFLRPQSVSTHSTPTVATALYAISCVVPVPSTYSDARTCASAKAAKPAEPGSRSRPVRSTSADLFGSAGGMWSVWDRLSSAALSAVQDVYGTPRDVRLSTSADAGKWRQWWSSWGTTGLEHFVPTQSLSISERCFHTYDAFTIRVGTVYNTSIMQ